jgi:hypothetical protein
MCRPVTFDEVTDGAEQFTAGLIYTVLAGVNGVRGTLEKVRGNAKRGVVGAPKTSRSRNEEKVV